ncbi:MAG: c-type cytochrome [Candidatus Acidiferrales bacterium]
MLLKHSRQSGSARNRGGLLIIVALAAAAALWFVGVEGLFFYPAGSTELTLPEARARSNPAPNSPETLAEAKALYVEHCANCHGDGGAGDGGEAMMYDPPPADFTDARMKNIRDGELFYKITKGDKPMPSFERDLTDDQRWKLVHYVRTFAAAPATQKQE